MANEKYIEFKTDDLKLHKLLQFMQNTIYEHNDDVQFLISEKCIKKVIKGLKNVSVHENDKETVVVLVAANKAANTHHMMILVGNNKTGLYEVRQLETDDKQYQGLIRDYRKDTSTIVTIKESRELSKNNNKCKK